MPSADIFIAHFDDDPTILDSTKDLLEISGIFVVAQAWEFQVAKALIPNLLGLGVSLALIDRDNGGAELAEFMKIICPTILRVGYANQPVPHTVSHIAKPCPPEQLAGIIRNLQ